MKDERREWGWEEELERGIRGDRTRAERRREKEGWEEERKNGVKGEEKRGVRGEEKIMTEEIEWGMKGGERNSGKNRKSENVRDETRSDRARAERAKRGKRRGETDGDDEVESRRTAETGWPLTSLGNVKEEQTLSHHCYWSVTHTHTLQCVFPGRSHWFNMRRATCLIEPQTLNTERARDWWYNLNLNTFLIKWPGVHIYRVYSKLVWFFPVLHQCVCEREIVCVFVLLVSHQRCISRSPAGPVWWDEDEEQERKSVCLWSQCERVMTQLSKSIYISSSLLVCLCVYVYVNARQNRFTSKLLNWADL